MNIILFIIGCLVTALLLCIIIWTQIGRVEWEKEQERQAKEDKLREECKNE